MIYVVAAQPVKQTLHFQEQVD
uniref:Uncharacterized protein n=1 Tax=Arundo donax TaxID=35708 RepID=A0A0A9E751_ARUDO